MYFIKNILKTIYLIYWVKFTKDGREYAKSYKNLRTTELTELIKSKGDA
jgi:hypothetical protein|tara:strand:- start:704 stop:850 length:147 start_codon:yes stop_codon:yes gene_type:complete